MKIHIQTKNLFGIVLFAFWALSVMGCSKDDKMEDRVENKEMYISSETSTYQPWGETQPVECMLGREAGQTDFQKIGFREISGFDYEKGYEYTLRVEKTTFQNPPADGSRISYRLIEILNRRWVPTPEPPPYFTEEDIKYKEGCPYPIYGVADSLLLIASDGRISDSKQHYSYESGRIYLDYLLDYEDTYYNRLLYMTTQAFVVDPLMKPVTDQVKTGAAPSHIRLIRVSDSGPLLKHVLGEKEFAFIKTQATVGQKFTYKLILLNAERLALQEIEITFSKI